MISCILRLILFLGWHYESPGGEGTTNVTVSGDVPDTSIHILVERRAVRAMLVVWILLSLLCHNYFSDGQMYKRGVFDLIPRERLSMCQPQCACPSVRCCSEVQTLHTQPGQEDLGPGRRLQPGAGEDGGPGEVPQAEVPPAGQQDRIPQDKSHWTVQMIFTFSIAAL